MSDKEPDSDSEEIEGTGFFVDQFGETWAYVPVPWGTIPLTLDETQTLRDWLIRHISNWLARQT